MSICRAGEWELAAEGDPETPIERYNRLRCEFSELLEQVAEQQNKATESEKVFLMCSRYCYMIDLRCINSTNALL